MEESEFCEAKNVFVDLCVKYTEVSRDEDDEGYDFQVSTEFCDDGCSICLDYQEGKCECECEAKNEEAC